MQIIAEIGQNHNGDINLAKELISSAKQNGADVVKFQIYNAKKLFSKKITLGIKIMFVQNCLRNKLSI